MRRRTWSRHWIWGRRRVWIGCRCPGFVGILGHGSSQSVVTRFRLNIEAPSRARLEWKFWTRRDPGLAQARLDPLDTRFQAIFLKAQVGSRCALQTDRPPMSLIRKADRRKDAERRVRTRAGRRKEDPTPVVFCRRCGSNDIAVALLGPGDRTLTCHACEYTWFARNKKTPR
jgi:hypothetical protein